MTRVCGSVAEDSVNVSTCEVVESRKSRHYHIELLRHQELGNILLLDGEVQHVEAWAPLYHEPLVHLPCSFVRDVRRVLLLGGGSLFAATEILKYPSITSLEMIDHDMEVVDICTRHYQHARMAMRDQRLLIRVEEIEVALDSLEGPYDLIISDSVDLQLDKFASQCERIGKLLTPNGVAADVTYRHIFSTRFDSRSQKWAKLLAKYNLVHSLVFVPEYPGILHLLNIWGQNPILRQCLKETHNQVQQRWLSGTLGSPCAYFNPRFLPYYLYLPPYLSKSILAFRNSAS